MFRSIYTLVLCFLVQSVSAQTLPEAASGDQLNTVMVSGGGQQVTIPYMVLRKFLDRFRSPGAESRSVEQRLLLGLGGEHSGFALNYTSKTGGKAQVMVSKFGVVDLPDLDPELAKTALLSTRLPDRPKSYTLSVVYLPRLQSRRELKYEQYVQFLNETDAAFSKVSWSSRMLFAGRMSAKANGITFCFADPNSSMSIGDTRISLNENGCISHGVDAGFHEKKPTIVFDGELVYARMLQGG